MTWWETERWREYERAYGDEPGTRVRELAEATWLTHVVDLTQTEEELWRNLRRSYKALIHRAEREYQILECGPDDVMAFRDIHIACAGRETRPLSTWLIMADWVLSGKMLLIGGMGASGRWLGFSAFILHGAWSYYSSSAVPRECEGLSHAIQWAAIKWLKSKGISRYELGWSKETSDPREQSISFFKAGFGGTLMAAKDGPLC